MFIYCFVVVYGCLLMNFFNKFSLIILYIQWYRPSATWGNSGAVPPEMTACAPPNENCASPSEDCAPEEINRLGLLEGKSRPKLLFFLWTDTGYHDVFGMKTFFLIFLEITCFRPEKKTFYLFIFFEDHLFSAGKTA